MATVSDKDLIKSAWDAILSSEQLLSETVAQLEPYRPNPEVMKLMPPLPDAFASNRR